MFPLWFLRAVLVEPLEHFPEVRELDLSQNRLGDLGAVALSQVLYPQGNVHQLDLTQNEIGDVGALAFIKALELNAAGPLGHEVRVVLEQNPVPEALLAAAQQLTPDQQEDVLRQLTALVGG